MRFPNRRIRLAGAALACASAVGLLAGCGKPSQANIELRKRIQDMETRAESAQRTHEADQARIRSLENEKGTLPTLPEDRLDKLFTTHAIKLGRLTGPGERGVKVYVVPTDDDGEPIKAAGSFVVEAFDLARQSDNRVGRWEFDLQQSRGNWFGRAMLYTYVLDCPWQNGYAPEHDSLTLRVTFHDELSQRTFTAEKVVAARVSPTTSASSDGK